MAKKLNYLSNKEILPEIIYYKEKGIATEKYGAIILEIATKISMKPSFIQYTWRDDMVGFACLICLKYSKNFDPEKSNNPFTYLSTIIHNAFKAYLNEQRKHKNIKGECYEMKHLLVNDEFNRAIDYTELKKQ